MTSRIPLTHQELNTRRIYIASEHTIFCDIHAIAAHDLPLQDQYNAMMAHAKSHKVQLIGQVRLKNELATLVAKLPDAIQARAQQMDELRTRWQQKLATVGLSYGCMIHDNEYLALVQLAGELEQTTHHNTVLGQAIALSDRMKHAISARGHSKVFL